MLALGEALDAWAVPRLLLCGDDRGREASRCAGVEPVMVGAALDETLEVARAFGATALVVDSYAVDPGQFAAARSHVRCLTVVDDMASFPLSADVVVNAALGVAPPPRAAGTRYLLGPRFALLGRAFCAPPERSATGEVRRVLVTLGGAASGAHLAPIVAAVRAAVPFAALDVVLGPAGDGWDVAERALEGLGATFHFAPDPIRPLMLAADLAVSAGGVTVYELAATATPTVGLAVAANQRRNLEGLARAGALRLAGEAGAADLAGAVRAAVAALAVDASARFQLGLRGRELVDGLGATRVAEAIRVRLAAGACAERQPC